MPVQGLRESSIISYALEATLELGSQHPGCPLVPQNLVLIEMYDLVHWIGAYLTQSREKTGADEVELIERMTTVQNRVLCSLLTAPVYPICG